MNEITYYEAFDGTRFDYKEDCIKYERNHQAKGAVNDIIIYSKKYGVKVAKDWDDLTDKLEYADYLYIMTHEGYKLYFEVSEYNGYYTNGVNSIMTLYKWNDNKECYEAIIEKLTDELMNEQIIENEMMETKNV